MVIFFIEVPVGVRVVACGQAHAFNICLLIGPDSLKAIGIVKGSTLMLINDRKSTRIGRLLQGSAAFELTVGGVESGNLANEMFGVLGRVVSILLLANVVRACAERRLPVHFIQVGVINSIHSA